MCEVFARVVDCDFKSQRCCIQDNLDGYENEDGKKRRRKKIPEAGITDTKSDECRSTYKHVEKRGRVMVTRIFLYVLLFPTAGTKGKRGVCKATVSGFRKYGRLHERGARLSN